MSQDERAAQSPSVEKLLPILMRALELGTCENNILTQLFAELESTPEALLPAQTPKLTWAAFLLSKCGAGEFAKRLLFTCLAWHLKNTEDQDAILSITKNLQYIFDKDGVSRSGEEIRQAAKEGCFDRPAVLARIRF